MTDPTPTSGRPAGLPVLNVATRADPVVLRPFRSDDASDLVTAMNDPVCVRFTASPPHPYHPEHARAFLADPGHTWVLDHDGRYAGQVGFVPYHEAGMVELAYLTAPWARGRGWMSPCVGVALCFAWKHGLFGRQVDAVLWRARVGNWGSRRIAWQHGFSFHGMQRWVTNQRGRARNTWSATLLRGETMQPRHPWFDPPAIDAADVRLRPLRDDDVPAIAQGCLDPLTQQWLPVLPTEYGYADAQAYLEIQREKQASGNGLCWAMGDPTPVSFAQSVPWTPPKSDGRDEASVGLVVGQESDSTLGTGDRVSAHPDDDPDRLCDPDRLAASDRLAGTVGLDVHGEDEGEIGYWVHPDHRGGGLATAAARAVVRHAFIAPEDGGLGLTRLLIRVAEPNLASQRVALTAGFSPSGRDRWAERLRDGSRVDLLRFDLLNPDR